MSDGEVVPACPRHVVGGHRLRNALDRTARLRAWPERTAPTGAGDLGTQPAVHYVNGSRAEKGEDKVAVQASSNTFAGA